MNLTDREKAAHFLGFKKCGCDHQYPTSFFRHPEKGWCCKCCDGRPIPHGEWIQKHYNGHHSAPDMTVVENWWKALTGGYAADPDLLQRAEGAIAMEVMGMKGAMEALLAREYDALHPVVREPDAPQPVPPAQKVRVQVVGSRRLKRAKKADQDLRTQDAGWDG